MNITVGPNKDFISITAAITASSSSGDTIFVYPDTYNEQLYLYNKSINIVGVTDDSSSKDVYVFTYSNYSIDIYNDAGSPKGPIYIEGLYLHCSPGYRPFQFRTNVVLSPRINVSINKCCFQCPSGNVIYVPNSQLTYGNVLVQNCRLVEGSTTFSINAQYFGRFDVIKTTVPVVPVVFQSGDPVIKDYTLYPEVNYGPAYGTYFNPPPINYYISGKVTKDSVPVERNVKLFHNDTNKYIGNVTSDSVTGEYTILTTFSGTHFVICEDDPTSPDYNYLIKSRCIPKSFPEITYTQQYFNVVNSDAETGNITGWQSDLGGFYASTSNSPYSGTYHFQAGAVAESIMHQRIDLEAAGIDTSKFSTYNHRINIASMHKSHDSVDAGILGIILRDSNQDIIGSIHYGVEHKQIVWECIYYMYKIVPGTKFIDLVLRGVRYNGTVCEVYFDNIQAWIDIPSR